MQSNAIKISRNFRNMALKSIGAILLFIFTYIILILLAIAFTVLCGYAGIMIIILKPMILTIMLGVGLISLGVLVLIFLVKFIFNGHKIDRSHLVEITKDQEPELFRFIEETVSEVDTSFPKKIYLSSDVNASVFYDSSFWSMFLPVKKNLQIGLGLLNSVSMIEFKAILAHEFGHFSQRSMKVGSYVYNVNLVIHNMLFDNNSYSVLLQKWSGISNYFTIFAGIAIKIVTGIQFILKRVYDVVNLNYLALSREMEFHADAVAAEVAGSQALIGALLRLDLADQSLNAVYSYYGNKIDKAEKTDNFYPQQYYVMNFLAEKNDLMLENGLPVVSGDHYKRFNKTKLVLKNQWSSHPSTEDRVAQLTLLNKTTKQQLHGISSTLLVHAEFFQEQFTNQLFSHVTYTKPAVIKGFDEFTEEYSKAYDESVYAEIYDGYFNERNPLPVDFDTSFEQIPVKPVLSLTELLSTGGTDLIYTSKSIEADLFTLKQIESREITVKTFDYDGQKYTPQDCGKLILTLEKELDKIDSELAETDKLIFNGFYYEAFAQDNGIELIEKYKTYQQVFLRFNEQKDLYVRLFEATRFVQTSTPFATIEENLTEVKRIEKVFAGELKKMMEEQIFQAEITEEIKAHFVDYLAEDWVYFSYQVYFDKELNLLFTAMGDFLFLLNRIHFLQKKKLLDDQLKLAGSFVTGVQLPIWPA